MKLQHALIIIFCSVVLMWGHSAMAVCSYKQPLYKSDFSGAIQITRTYYRGEIIKDLGWSTAQNYYNDPVFVCANTTSEPYTLSFPTGVGYWDWISGMDNVLKSHNPGIGIRIQFAMDNPSIPVTTIASGGTSGRVSVSRNTQLTPTVRLRIELVATGEPITNDSIHYSLDYGVQLGMGFDIFNSYAYLGSYFFDIKNVSVIIPLSCTITGGNRDVNFNENYSHQIDTRGTSDIAAKTIDLGVNCNQPGGVARTQLSFTGTRDNNDNTVLGTTNKDIGIQVKDVNGATLTPNSSKIPTTSQGDGTTGYARISLKPINTTGNTKPSGAYSSTATMTIEYK
ncbi:fimbrial protein [Enterobacter adelaidei]